MSNTIRVTLLIPSLASVKTFFIPLLKQSLGSNVCIELITSKNERGFIWKKEIPSTIPVYFIDFPEGVNPLKWFHAKNQVKQLFGERKYHLVHAHFSLAIILLSLIKTKTPRWGTFQSVYYY